MYPSDEYMVYGNDVNTKCYTHPTECSGTNAKTGWVYNSNTILMTVANTWLLSPLVGTSDHVLFVLNDDGYCNGHFLNYCAYSVRPVVYLSSNVQIFDGDGSSENPYKLK